MQLPHATALIAVLLIIVLSAGYATAERGDPQASSSRTQSADSH